MNTKNNRRRRESIDKMEKTFVEMLQTKELADITVSDLCKQCGLNRSTFYANYTDVYDLADQIKKQLETQVMGLYGLEEQSSFGMRDYLPLFEHMKQNQLFYKTYFKLGYDEQHPIKLYDMARASQAFDSKSINYHIAFFRSGFNAIVKMWLANGCQETPEEMNEIIRSEYRGRE